MIKFRLQHVITFNPQWITECRSINNRGVHYSGEMIRSEARAMGNNSPHVFRRFLDPRIFENFVVLTYVSPFISVSVCNITLDSRQLFSKSDRGFGQIKSPSLEGPSRCTYRFVPDTGQRVELQIYRLISIGRHNGTA